MPIKKRIRVSPLSKIKRTKLKYKCPLCGHHASIQPHNPIDKSKITNTLIF